MIRQPGVDEIANPGEACVFDILSLQSFAEETMDSIDHLLTGIHQFHTDIFQNERQFFAQLASGQHPSALFISCSDSRVDPSIITQAHLGQLFVLRNAGNIVPCYGASNGGEPATIEYAVNALGVKDIIVCGHSGCGAVQAMLHPETMEKLPLVKEWLRHAEATRQIVTENYPQYTGEAQLEIAVREHVLVQIENLQTHPCVAVKLQRGDLTLHAWIYRMETGEVLAYSTEDGGFAALTHLEPHEASKRNVANPRKGKKSTFS
jgi:carbonic anhydrase